MKSRQLGIRFFTLLVACLLAGGVALAADKFAERVKTSAEVYQQLVEAPDQGVPEKLLKGARCVAVIPGVKKAALGVGGRHGKGIISCRKKGGKWSPISFLTLSGGSFGFQIGGSSTDLVLFIMSERGAKSLLSSNFTLGADASVAAGPVGRSAEASTDVALEADIYAYARAKGLFAGIALDGASLRRDGKAVRDFYGKDWQLSETLFDHQPSNPPATVATFLKVLP